jgi:hypothetical protein
MNTGQGHAEKAEFLDFMTESAVLYLHIAGGAERLRVLIQDDPWNLIRVVPA